MKFWYALAAVFVSIFMAVTVSIIYTQHATAKAIRTADAAIVQSQQDLCTVLVPIADSYNHPPVNVPLTELGKHLAVLFNKLVEKYHCVED